jgi:hypothetical protein
LTYTLGTSGLYPSVAAAQQPGDPPQGRFPHIRDRRGRHRLPGKPRQRHQDLARHHFTPFLDTN